MSIESLPVASTTVECSGRSHQLLWRAGRLETPDHAEPDAERVLTALGGEPCRCIALADAWSTHAADPRALVLGPRGPKVKVISPASPAENRSGHVVVFSSTRGGPQPSTPALGIEDLFALTGGLPRRLLATSAAALIATTAGAPLDSRLEAALYGRVLTALGRWRGVLGQIDLTVIGAGETPSVISEGSALRVMVSTDWLVDVWGAGLEIVADRFILAARPNGADLALQGVDQSLTPVRLTLTEF